MLRVKIMGRIWKVVFTATMGKNRGTCDPPSLPGKAIHIWDKLTGQERLEVILHEFTHCAGWHLDESFVSEFARDAARGLWKLGYRGPI